MIAHKPRFQIHPRLSLALARQLKAYCTATNTTETAVAEAAFAQYLNRTDDHTILMKRLDRVSHQLDRMCRDNLVFLEAFATFVHIWYAYTPELPDEAKVSAKRQAARRFEIFIQCVVERLGKGHPFLDDLVNHDLFANQEELEQAARTGI